MILLLDKASLYSTFEASSFDELEDLLEQYSPSIIKYHLDNLISTSCDSYSDKTNIEKTLYLHDFLLYLDYNQDIYIEISQQDNNHQTSLLLTT